MSNTKVFETLKNAGFAVKNVGQMVEVGLTNRSVSKLEVLVALNHKVDSNRVGRVDDKVVVLNS
jgi:hypothetical protein